MVFYSGNRSARWVSQGKKKRKTKKMGKRTKAGKYSFIAVTSR